MRLWGLTVALAACGGPCGGHRREARPPTPPVDDASPLAVGTWTCTPEPFAESTPLPEASGAAWMTIDGASVLVAIADSGSDGTYAVIDPDTGETREMGQLPLGERGDDLEGVAVRDGKLVAVTSPGWLRTWRRIPGGFELVDGPYPIGPVDLPDRKKPPEGDGMVCPATATNCGRNYEGLCLAPDTVRGGTIGFVASKTDGVLYPLVERDGRYAVSRAGAIPVMKKGALADCAFDGDILYAAGNVFDTRVFRIAAWRDARTSESAGQEATIEAIGALGPVNPETLAVRGDIIYRMSDAQSDSSLMAKYRCRAP